MCIDLEAVPGSSDSINIISPHHIEPELLVPIGFSPLLILFLQLYWVLYFPFIISGGLSQVFSQASKGLLLFVPVIPGHHQMLESSDWGSGEAIWRGN